MKFISKSSNYCIILRPSISAEPITGRTGVPGISVKFENGVAIINDDETCRILMNNKAFNKDFILADDLPADPFYRKGNEPEHDIIPIEFGHVGKKSGDPLRSPELNKMIIDLASKMAEEIAPRLAKKIIADLADKQKKSTDTIKEEKCEDKLVDEK